MYLLCIVLLCISVILQSSVHTSDGWRHAFTYRWIKVYKPLFITYVLTDACVCVFLFVHTDCWCSILHDSTQYSHGRIYWTIRPWYSISEYNYLVINRQCYEYICLIRKKENVKLGSYMCGAKFYNVTFDQVYLNKFKVEISSLPRRSQNNATLVCLDDPYVQTIVP